MATLMDASSGLRHRLGHDGDSRLQTTQAHRYEAIRMQVGSRNHLGDVYGGQHHHHYKTWADRLFTTAEDSKDGHRRSLREALAFDQMNDRYANIETAALGTCQWIFGSSEYKSWRNKGQRAENHGCLWIKGNAGAGKSTIMKCLMQHAKEAHKNEKLIFFFFNASGGDLERSTSGMYRSILCQMVDKAPSLQECISVEAIEHHKRHGWPLEVLKDLYRDAIRKLAGKGKVTCYIDALDECANQDDLREMIFFLEETATMSVSKGWGFLLCLASRHYPTISMAHFQELRLTTHPNHGKDIAAYTRSKLRVHNLQLLEDLTSEISRRASGIFLWVVLVVKVLNEEAGNGKQHDLRTRLQDLPPGLDELFENILDIGGTDERLSPALQWALFALRPLDPIELYFAIMTSTADLTAETICLDRETVNKATITDYILSSSKGLLEVPKFQISSDPQQSVQVIHETVRDYLLRRGLQKVDRRLRDNVEGSSHEQLAKWCQLYLLLTIKFGIWDEIASSLIAIRSVDESEFVGLLKITNKFFRYAVGHALDHANQAVRYGLHCAVHADIPLKVWLRATYFLAHGAYDPRPQTMFHVLVSAGCLHLVKAELERMSVYPQDDGTALHLAIRGHHAEMVHTLLDHGADPNIGTALHTAILTAVSGLCNVKMARRGGSWFYREVVELLLNAGADINASTASGGIPLDFLVFNACYHYGWDSEPINEAVIKYFTGLIQLLIDRGAVVNISRIQTLFYQPFRENWVELADMLLTADSEANAMAEDASLTLHDAARNGHAEMIEVLLKHGVKIDALSKENKSALDLAIEMRYSAAVRVLRAHGAKATREIGCYDSIMLAVDRILGVSLHRLAESCLSKLLTPLQNALLWVLSRRSNIIWPAIVVTLLMYVWKAD